MRVDGMRGYRARFILNFRLVFVLSKTQVFSGLLNEPLEETVLTASGPGLEVVNTDALVRLVLVSQARGQGHGGETVSLPSWFVSFIFFLRSPLLAVSFINLFANDCLFRFWWDNWFIITWSRFNSVDCLITR